MCIRTYGFVRCFTRPPDTSARNHRHEVDHVEAMSSPCWCAVQSSATPPGEGRMATPPGAPNQGGGGSAGTVSVGAATGGGATGVV
jgi:hypothetical protein